MEERMKTLDEIAIERGTDKASKHPLIAGHNYCLHYDKFFSEFRDQPIKFLEIGVGGAESIKTWLDYFHHPDTRIWGVDNVQSTNDWNTVGAKPDPRYTFVYGDQSDETFWKCFVVDYGDDWTVLVDDGGHFSHQVITTHRMMWPHIAIGGLYCIEDLGVAYGPGSIFCTPKWQNHMDFIKDKIDELNQANGIDSLYLSRELAIIRKK